jgi:hypothetical protein
MKAFLLALAVLGAVFLWQREPSKQSSPPSSVATSAQPQAGTRQVWEHDWAKHSLDRAHSVAEQVQKTRQENQP